MNVVFLARLIAKVIWFRGRVSSRGIAVRFESGVRLRCGNESRIVFGSRAFLSRLTNIEAYSGATVSLGSNFSLGKNSSIVARSGVSIGDHCQFGPNVHIYDHDHLFKPGTLIRDQGYRSAPIRIGDNVWIGAGVFVGRGVTIGDDCVIGAGAVVTRDIPSGHVAVNKTMCEVRRIAFD